MQAAALALIAAARAFLDAAEDVVKDPSQATQLALTLAEMANPVAGAARGRPADPSSAPRVQRIRVS